MRQSNWHMVTGGIEHADFVNKQPETYMLVDTHGSPNTYELPKAISVVVAGDLSRETHLAEPVRDGAVDLYLEAHERAVRPLQDFVDSDHPAAFGALLERPAVASIVHYRYGKYIAAHAVFDSLDEEGDASAVYVHASLAKTNGVTGLDVEFKLSELVADASNGEDTILSRHEHSIQDRALAAASLLGRAADIRRASSHLVTSERIKLRMRVGSEGGEID